MRLKLGKKDVGFTETVRKYAWFPTIMTNDDLVWFEHYTETRVWDRLFYRYGWNVMKRVRG